MSKTAQSMKQPPVITINGVEYTNPECHCKGAGHICYLRPTPQVIDMKLEDIDFTTKGNAKSPSNPTRGR